MTRKLVTKRTVGEVIKHPNADALDLIHIDGWQVVSKLGEFKEGDPCVFFEIDSFLPADDDRFSFLAKGGVKKDESGKERIRLKTIKLRKELSQGLALPWDMFPDLHDQGDLDDYSDALGVIKYERPEPKVANAAGNFPSYLRKTDEERVQNLWGKWKTKHKETEFIPTLKLDGSSCTVSYLDYSVREEWPEEKEGDDPKSMHIGTHRLIVCSRNLMLKHDPDSHFWKAVVAAELDDKMADMWKAFGRPFAIQGEVCGPGVQGNKEGFTGFQFFAFNLFDIKNQKYIPFDKALEHFENFDIPHVPVLGNPVKVFDSFEDLEHLLEHADGPSINAKVREGVVWKAIGDGEVSMKCISNKFLLKGGDD